MNHEQSVSEGKTKRLRGAGRGSRFMVLGRENYAKLRSIKSENLLNLTLAYLVLLAGTGADHRLTSWSAKACEEKIGIGRPRATAAIVELINSGLVSVADDATPSRPRYVMEPPGDGPDQIFLPMQIVTGFQGEEPVLRRVRETGDFVLLKMLLDIYGSLQLDAAFSAPLSLVQQLRKSPDESAQKVFERGVHNLWRLQLPDVWKVGAEWHKEVLELVGSSKANNWSVYSALTTLINIGALKVENWIYTSDKDDAEPLIPLWGGDDALQELYLLIDSAIEAFLGDEVYVQEKYADDQLIFLPSHVSAPAVRGVIKPRIEADTPGRRRTYARKMEQIGHFAQEMRLAQTNFSNGRYDRAISLLPAPKQVSNG